MSYHLIPNIAIFLSRTAFVYNNTNYAVPFMTLQPSSTLCVCVCVCMRACVCMHAYMFACTCTHTHAFICEYMFVYIHTRTLLSVMS